MAGLSRAPSDNFEDGRSANAPAKPRKQIVGADGWLSGAIAGAQVTGRIANNRSWFGRLMNWREDYAIRGALWQPVSLRPDAAAERFTGLLGARGSNLEGVLMLRNRQWRVRFTKQ